MRQAIEPAPDADPTENPQAYDLFLRGKSFARRVTRQDTEFALQMFENAVSLDPEFALAHAANAIFCAQYYQNFQRDAAWSDRARNAADRVLFMDEGTVVEEGPPAAIFERPAHPRTRAFIGQIQRH